MTRLLRLAPDEVGFVAVALRRWCAEHEHVGRVPPRAAVAVADRFGELADRSGHGLLIVATGTDTGEHHGLAGELADFGTVAEWLGCSERTVRRLVSRGELTGHRVGRLVRIPTATVVRYLEEHPR